MSVSVDLTAIIGETKANVQERQPMTQTLSDSPVCAVGAIVFRGNTVLLIRRAKEPARGQWSIPGGKVLLGETLKEAVMRELREEAGMDVRPIGVGKVVDRIYRETNGKISYHYV